MSSSARKQAMEQRRAHWRCIVDEAAQSRLSIRQFCKERNVDEQQLYYWRRVLKEERNAATAEQAARFVLVRPDGPSPAGSARDALELMLDRGWRLRIPRGVDEMTLRCVLTALSAQA
jgi:hypothetical protein